MNLSASLIPSVCASTRAAVSRHIKTHAIVFVAVVAHDGLARGAGGGTTHHVATRRVAPGQPVLESPRVGRHDLPAVSRGRRARPTRARNSARRPELRLRRT